MRINCNELSYKMRREITSDKESVWYGTRDIRWAKARPGGLPNPARDDRTWDPNRKRWGGTGLKKKRERWEGTTRFVGARAGQR